MTALVFMKLTRFCFEERKMGATRSDITPNVLTFQDVRPKHTINQAPTQGSELVAPVSSKLSSALELEIQNWAATLRERFVELQDHPERAAMAGKLFLRSIKPSSRRPGRPQKQQITRAIELLDSGVPWRKIPGLVIDSFDDMIDWQKKDSARELRHSIWTRRDRERRKRIHKSQIGL